MKKESQWLFRQLFRPLPWVLCLALAYCTTDYVIDARKRIRADDSMRRWMTTTDTVKDISYTASSTLVDRDTVLVRLYRTGDPQLLAERMYTERGVEISWGTDRLIYDTSDDSFLGGAIRLPPTRLDNFLAKLP